jgi:NhaP-type Na+/H+ or K+/H+ antiporter
LIGFIIGGLTLAVSSNASDARSNDFRQIASVFTPHFFFLLLLPPIVFEGGYNMRRQKFFANFAAISVLGVLGTLVSAAVVGALLYLLARGGVIFELSLVECLLFGSLISATDPVAVLAVFQGKKVDDDLYSILLGESILNDAVAIVLFETLAKVSCCNLCVLKF